ncbi:hypothetical protein [Simiduia aestuariiviva]|uniref:Uncharacterized protein n=1 Tax=Simiduia aestuariiviva TaxID=1510459 RepID=A0A839UVF2_9GAMM|nr:hypothetical protein [Simiduia aestuariiviva]MBB3169448.1 hypothetical protein [Simiduia aestuariiviva]
MKKLILILLLIPIVVYADKLSDEPLAGVSQEGLYVVRINNAEENVLGKGIARIYRLDGEVYKKVSEFLLKKSMWLPTNVLISSAGNVYTLSDRASDDALTIYGLDGRLIKSLTLDQLIIGYQEDPEMFKQTISTVRWLCPGFKPWIHGDLLIAKLSSGDYLSVEDGNFEIFQQADRKPCSR